jgi:hypothetical protein
MSRFGYPDCEHPRDPQSTEVNGQEYNQAHVRTPFLLDKQPEEIGGKGTANHEGYVEQDQRHGGFDPMFGA